MDEWMVEKYRTQRPKFVNNIKNMKIYNNTTSNVNTCISF